MSFIFTLILAAVTGVLFAVMGWPIQVLFACIIAITLINFGILIYTSFYTTNMKTVEKFVKKHKKNPIYYYAYILPTATEAELMEALQKIVLKYKQPKYQAVYGTHLALMKEDTIRAKQFNEPIAETEVGRYNEALIDVCEGLYDKALQANVEKPWMKHSIQAHIAFYQKDFNTFKAYAEKSIDAARGIQLYGNIHTFARMEQELKNQP